MAPDQTTDAQFVQASDELTSDTRLSGHDQADTTHRELLQFELPTLETTD